MNKITFFLFSLCALIMGCTKVNDLSTHDLIEVRIHPTGEIAVSETALSKASATESRDLYGVQIEKVTSTGTIHYCYGLFDNMSLAVVKMYADESYVVEVGYIPNGKDIVKLLEGTEEYGSWEIPFNNSNWNKVALNEFTYDATSEIFHLEYPFTVTNGMTRTDGPHRSGISYYYAKSDNFTPTENNHNLNVNLVRYNFGLEFKFKSSEYSGVSKVKIQVDPEYASGHETFYVDINPDAEYSSIEITPVLLSYCSVSDSVSISIGTDDEPTQFYTGAITVERNKMYHITVTPPDSSIGSSVTVQTENTPMTDVEQNL